MQVRQWLWDEIGLSSLYRADMWAYEDNGTRGPREYLERNAHLAEIHGIVVLGVVAE